MTPIVCWDFDETIEYFRPWEFQYLGQPMPENVPQPRLKPGIRDLLRSLREFTHVLTTAANGEYARFVLKQYDLLDFFDGVFGREEGIFLGEGKDYRAVGEFYGMKELEWLVSWSLSATIQGAIQICIFVRS
jgi:phosphoserine phosphatase